MNYIGRDYPKRKSLEVSKPRKERQAEKPRLSSKGRGIVIHSVSEAKEKLIESYREEHKSYKRTRDNVRFFYFWSMVAIPVLLMILVLSWIFPGFAARPKLIIPLFVIIGILLLGCSNVMSKARRRLVRQKILLEEEGLRIVCRRTKMDKLLCIIPDAKISEKDIVFPQGNKIDFLLYDMAFR